MSYSGVEEAKAAKETLGEALAALQDVEDVPEEVEKVTENIAEAVGALFEAERASSEIDGKSAVRSALGSLSQTLALHKTLETTSGAANGHRNVGHCHDASPLTMRPTMTPM